MTMQEKQIGWYNLKEDTVFHKADFECAAWCENIKVKAGRYPIVLMSGYRILRKNGWLIDAPYVIMTGEIVSDYFGTMFCGNPIGGYDTEKNKGATARYTMHPYPFEVGRSICEDPDSPYELFPEWEAKAAQYISSIDGREATTYDLYLTNVDRSDYRVVEYA